MCIREHTCLMYTCIGAVSRNVLGRRANTRENQPPKAALDKIRDFCWKSLMSISDQTPKMREMYVRLRGCRKRKDSKSAHSLMGGRYLVCGPSQDMIRGALIITFSFDSSDIFFRDQSSRSIHQVRAKYDVEVNLAYSKYIIIGKYLACSFKR